MRRCAVGGRAHAGPTREEELRRAQGRLDAVIEPGLEARAHAKGRPAVEEDDDGAFSFLLVLRHERVRHAPAALSERREAPRGRLPVDGAWGIAAHVLAKLAEVRAVHPEPRVLE